MNERAMPPTGSALAHAAQVSSRPVSPRPTRQGCAGAWTRRAARMALLLLAGAALAGAAWVMAALPPGARSVSAQAPNPFEQQSIEAQAKESYQRFIKLWQEELYFELYDLGIQSTRDRITREEFARRMVELAWVPDGQLNQKYLQAEMRFRTMVYVKARVTYRHKFNPDIRFSKDQTALLLYEGGKWRLDLIQLIRSPYAT